MFLFKLTRNLLLGGVLTLMASILLLVLGVLSLVVVPIYLLLTILIPSRMRSREEPMYSSQLGNGSSQDPYND